MARTGRDRKASPLAVWQAAQKIWGSFASVLPKPKPSESFGGYLKRVDWKEEAIFFAMIALGCTSDGSFVDQREYLMALEHMSNAIYKFRKELSDVWPN
jgi:hypothetical protein